MATKPALATPKWATNLNYTVGPKTGQPTKADLAALRQNGQVPGPDFPMGAQTMNHWQGSVADWLADWVALGSATGAYDAHPLETDSVGRTSIAGLILLGNSSFAGPTARFDEGATNYEVLRINRVDGGNTAIVKLGGPNTDLYGVEATTYGAVAFRAVTLDAPAFEMTPLIDSDPVAIPPDGSSWAVKKTSTTPDVMALRVFVREKRHLAHTGGHWLHLAASDEGAPLPVSDNSEKVIFDNVDWPIGSIPFVIDALYPATQVIVEYSFGVAVDVGAPLAITVRFYDGAVVRKSWIITVPDEYATQQSLRYTFVPDPGPADYKISVQRTAGANYTLSNHNLTMRTST